MKRRRGGKVRWRVYHPSGNPASDIYAYRRDAMAWLVRESGHTWGELYRTGYRCTRTGRGRHDR